ncbi:hypothetical protein [Nitratireductor luteus]|uniref:hyaluronate lyase N-terminal domain-containing protein n=1 Tax=Nitratireductor luteus TaxID=2976980 RepID=UPI00223F2FC3|nr:hypothetical protein [Nitratireductor luteus]
MSTQIQRRRGTTAQHATFTGALGEITIDTDKNVPVVHDGVTAGGHPLAPEALVAGGTLGQILAVGEGGSREWVDNAGYTAEPMIPSISFGGASDGITYDVGGQTGGAVRIGDMVVGGFRVKLTNKGTSVGDAALEGLPFPIHTDFMGVGGVLSIGFYSGMALPGTGISGFFSSGTGVYLRSFGAGQAATLNDTHFTNTSTIIGGYSYMTVPA